MRIKQISKDDALTYMDLHPEYSYKQVAYILGINANLLQYWKSKISPINIQDIPIPEEANRQSINTFIEKAYIYYLYNNGICVYIGQTFNVSRRLKEHLHTKKIFNEIAFFEVNAFEVDRIERILINRYRPKYNIM
jgi:hypothetical protein